MDMPISTRTLAEARQAILSQLPEDTVLIAASKRQPDARIEAALAAGHRVFGENRVQEAGMRWRHRRAAYPDLALHLIGPLQTNKADAAVCLFDVIHTLDRPKLLNALIKAQARTGAAPPDLFIQVNTGAEPQKAGIHIDALDPLVTSTQDMWPGKLLGLMCIPPAEEPAAPHFALLKRLADQYGLAAISMGMSQDYALAAQLGATHVRVGTALFGARDASA